MQERVARVVLKADDEVNLEEWCIQGLTFDRISGEDRVQVHYIELEPEEEEEEQDAS